LRLHDASDGGRISLQDALYSIDNVARRNPKRIDKLIRFAGMRQAVHSQQFEFYRSRARGGQGMHMNSATAPDRATKAPASSPATPVVFVVDDDVSVREALELLIRFAGWQPERFECAQEFLSRPRVLVPNCLILDVALPGLNGLDLQKLVAVDRKDMPIIFITGYGDIPTTVQGGAVEFLTKPFGDDELPGAIERALERSKTSLRDETETRELSDRHGLLSHREQQVMGLVASGRLNKQLGGELGISEITVKAHRGQVMRKMGRSLLPVS
jgi:FixJ family two-component response regulator